MIWKKINSNYLIIINNFVKKRLFELTGILLILASFFLFASIITYTPNDPNFIYNQDNSEIQNITGFYGSVISDFILQSIGLISILLVINLFYWGLKIITKKIILNFIPKIFFSIIYIISGSTFVNISFNSSFWLIDNGNSGFVGRIVKESIYNFNNLAESQYFVYFLVLVTFVFFILSLGITLNEINKILLFPFKVVKKLINLFFRKKK